MARSKQPITFIVPGQDRAAAAGGSTRGAAPAAGTATSNGLGAGRVKHAVTLGTQRGGAGAGAAAGVGAGSVRLQAVPGEDVVVLHLAQGPSLVLSPENARLLMLGQGEALRPPAPPPAADRTTRGARPASTTGTPVAHPDADADAPGSVDVPMQLQWRGLEQAQLATTRGATRGGLGQVLLSGLEVLTGFAKDALTDKAADFATAQVVQHVDGQVTPGVYALQPTQLNPLKGQPVLARVPPATAAAGEAGPLLVLLHGTFSNTAGTFGKLWGEHPGKVRTLFDAYAGRVYALDHPTLGASPIDNALMLAQALPQGAQLHLLTHSRGGLVAEVLARACALRGVLGDEQLAFFDAPAEAAAKQALQQLVQLVAERGIRVTRVLRVACPARGTLLASTRLDAYLSVLKWAMELAGLVVTPALLGLLAEVARRRADPAELPGLAAMLPGSALVQWLHAVDEPLPGELRVVAGDLAGDSLVSWVKTLLADSYYWCDNDLVVHTSSMYGGAPRAAQAAFLLDQGGKVSHFNYFSNERTAAAIVDGLVQPALPQAYAPIGPLSAAGESSTGLRGGVRAAAADDGTPAADKPAVFLLPGILGSNLKKDGKRIWLGWRIVNGLKQLAYTGQPDGVEPDGPMGLSYGDLAGYLRATHEVIEFGYDWRKPVELEAQRLGQAVEAALAARDASGQPVRLLAHSMGGVLARTLQLECPDTWLRLMARPGGRLLMLGTPNGGSWAPMQVLSGDDSFGNTLVAFGAPFQDHAARMLMATFPGFIQLQAGLLDDPRRLDLAETWQQLAVQDLATVQQHNWWHSGDASQLNTFRWGVPPQAVLDQAVALRKRLDAQRDTVLPQFADKLLLVVGHERFTPDGYQFTDEGLSYLDAPQDGDGRVTLASARLPGVATWQMDCAHGKLADEEEAFDALLDILQTGGTQRLPRLPELAAPALRGSGEGTLAASARARVPHRPSRSLRLARPPAAVDDAWLSSNRTAADEPADGAAATTPRAQAGHRAAPALRIELLNSDLGFVAQPLLLGHYRALALTGTEQVVNRLVGGAMQASLAAGLYPDAPGSHQVFVNTQAAPDNPWRLPRPEAVIVLGLGEEGQLTPADLSRTVRQGVIAWGQRMAEQPGLVRPQMALAATLLGSGGSGISAGQAAQQVALGVREANERLRAAGWPVVGTLTLIELYLDRASEAWRALQGLAAGTPGLFDLRPTVRFGSGALRRPADYGYRGANNDLISALAERDPQGGDNGTRIVYTLATRRARTELRAQATQLKLVSDLVQSASTHENGDPLLGRSLFQLLVPPELEAELGAAQSLVMELDAGTAGIPWELLDTRARDVYELDSAAQPPWALRCKLLRKLRLDDFRPQVRDAHPGDDVLVIGEPQCDPAVYPSLPGASSEARAVTAALTGPQCLGADRVQLLLAPDARGVINTLLSRDWRIVHIAGHGEPPRPDNPCGVVLGGDTFLGPREIETMRVVPELVFVNCCHLAARSAGELLQTTRGQPLRNHAVFAAGVAEALIKVGVRCVIAAGWAVDDAPAALFATTFYARILQGERFIDAVAAARQAAWGHGRQGNTWAAYQCYGDPDWVLRRDGADAQQPPVPLTEEFSGIASPAALTLALERIAVALQYQGAAPAAQRDKIHHLAARFTPEWGAMGAVAEAFGLAASAAGDLPAAIDWYARAAAANDGSASLKALEQLGNLRVRQAWQRVKPWALASSPANGRKGRAQQGDGDATAALDEAEAGIRASLAQLEQLTRLQPTAERASLCGSACKRLAMVLRLKGASHSAAHRDALAAMRGHYRQAFELAGPAASSGAGAAAGSASHYAGLNLLTAEWLTDGRLDADHLAAVKASLAAEAQQAPDFWCMAGQAQVRLLEALAAASADAAWAREVAAVQADFADLHARVSAAWLWESVQDQMMLVLPGAAAGRAGGCEKLLASLSGYVGRPCRPTPL